MEGVLACSARRRVRHSTRAHHRRLLKLTGAVCSDACQLHTAESVAMFRNRTQRRSILQGSRSSPCSMHFPCVCCNQKLVLLHCNLQNTTVSCHKAHLPWQENHRCLAGVVLRGTANKTAHDRSSDSIDRCLLGGPKGCMQNAAQPTKESTTVWPSTSTWRCCRPSAS